MVETTAIVLGVLVSFAIAIGVRVLVNRTLLPYTVLLVTAGFMLSVFPLQTYLGFNLDPLFTHDVILFIFLPAIVFLGAAEIDHERFRQNLLITVITVLVGLPVAITAIGWLGTKLFEMPLLIMLLFGAMAYPIDPVAVLSLFEEAGAPAGMVKRLADRCEHKGDKDKHPIGKHCQNYSKPAETLGFSCSHVYPSKNEENR